jgi:hypothetical protein
MSEDVQNQDKAIEKIHSEENLDDNVMKTIMMLSRR